MPIGDVDMKKMCACIVTMGAVTGMMIGAIASLMTVAIMKEKLCVGELMMCKAKNALSNLKK